MRRSFGSRLLACMVALSMVLASFPARAFADGTGSGNDIMWTAPLGAYANRTEFFYAYMVNQGYPLTDKNNNQIRRWDSMPYNYQAALSTTGGFYGSVTNFTAVDYLSGNYLLLRIGPDLLISDIQAELQRNYDAMAANSGPTVPGGGGFGGGGGGGGGTPSEPVGLFPPFTAPYDTGNIYLSPLYQFVTVSNKFSLSGSIKSEVASRFGSSGIAHSWVTWEGNTGAGFANVWFAPSSVEVVKKDNHLFFYNSSGSAVTIYNAFCGDVFLSNNTLALSDYQGVYDHSIDSLGYYDISNITYLSKYIGGGSGGGGTGGGGGTVEGGGTPHPSTITKPESPASPTNPATPERETQTIVVSGTTQQVPSPVESPDLSTIEDLLRRILANTNTIIEQMNSFSSQLGQQLADFYGMVYDWFVRLDSWLDQLQAQMTRQLAWDDSFFDWLSAIDQDIQYLQSICTTGFNDVVSWLQNIFNRMAQAQGGGSKPSITDPDDTSPVMDWLRKVWADFLADLQIVLPDQVGAVVDFLDQLRQKFPFSIPWDIAAMLALLSHDPVTPVFDIPWGYGEGVQDVHIDLHSWDGVMETVRPMFLLLFAFGLALLTKDLLSGLEGLF